MAAPTQAAQGSGTPAVHEHRWRALVVIAVAQLMIALDATVVNVALPQAQQGLGFSDEQRAWVITAYLCTFAGLMLIGGRIADRVGRRRAFLGGLVGFAAASAFAGIAPNIAMLATGRALQGVFAAVLAPTALSLIAVTFTDTAERAKAFGVYGAVASSGGALGLLLGGALTEYVGWRWCLFINIPIAVAALLLGRAVLPTGDGYPQTRIDLLSGVLAATGIGVIVYGCTRAATSGWASAEALAPALAGVVLIAAFLLRQARTVDPILPLWVLTDRARAGAYLAVAVAVMGSFGLFLMLTFHFQAVLGWSPLRTGLAFLPLSVAVSFGSFGLGARLLPHLPPRWLITPGLVVSGAGLLLLSAMSVDSSYLTQILPAEIMLGLGMGCVFTPAISVATGHIDRRFAGIAAATATTFMQAGGAIGTATLNSVAVAATASAGIGITALVHGFAVAAGLAGIVLLAAALVVAVLITTPRPEPSTR